MPSEDDDGAAKVSNSTTRLDARAFGDAQDVGRICTAGLS